MAAQSKLLLSSVQRSDRAVKRLITELSGLYLKHRTRISRAVYLTLFLALVNRIRYAIAEQKAAAAPGYAGSRRGRPGPGKGDGNRERTGRKKVELNREFFKSLLLLLRIVIPGWRSKELRLLVSHSVFLVLRTMLSLYVAELDGKLVANLIRGRGKDFLTGLVWWMIVAVPATFTNSMVRARNS